MRLFLYEYAMARSSLDVPASIRREGRAMFDALRADALSISGLEIIPLLDAPASLERFLFQSLAARADWSLVIAPETEGILLERHAWVTQAGGRFLGPTAEAIRLTGDKWETYVKWRERGVRTPETWLSPPPSAAVPIVRKLRDGAGSQEMRLINPVSIEVDGQEWLWQEFVPGQAVSMAFLIGPAGNRLPLLPADQHLAQDGSFRYLGGALPLEPRLSHRAQILAEQALNAIPGLFGFVGVDMVLGNNTDGTEDHAIEINPRLTTSYVGLRAMAEVNLLGVLLDVVQGKEVPPLRWRKGSVSFDAQGQVQRFP